jgi:CBS domain-containing protein
MRHVTGATPLFALKAVALDLETTSLDVKEARVVQIGALHIDGGEIAEAAPFERMVNPLIPIPPAVTAVHGITDAMAGDAASLAAQWADFSRFISGRVMIGHTLAYDLTVLRKEAHRHRLE